MPPARRRCRGSSRSRRRTSSSSAARAATGTARRSPAAPRRPWDADPDRSDATQRAYGGRARTVRRPARERRGPAPAARSAGDPGRRRGGRSGHDGRRRRARRARRRTRTAQPGTAGPGPRRRAPADAVSTAPASGPGGADGRARRPAPPRAPGSRGRRNKATLGSTSYDGVERAVRARLGRRELVRHHERHVLDAQPEGIRGPAQARARVPGARPADRPVAGRDASRRRHDTAAATTATAADATEPARRPSRSDADRRPPPQARRRPADPHDERRGGSRRPARPPDPADARPRRADRATSRPPPDATQPCGRAHRRRPDLGRAIGRHRRAPHRRPTSGGWRGRVVRAVIGWLPIALGLGWLIGELTGCGRFAATCDGSADPIVLAAPAGACSAAPAGRPGRSRSLTTMAAADRCSAARRRGRPDPVGDRGRRRRRFAPDGARRRPASSPGSSGSRIAIWRRLRAISATDASRILRSCPATPRSARPVHRRAGIPARAARPGRFGRRRPGDRRADRTPPRGHHAGRQRDVPPTRRGRARRPCRGPRPASHAGRSGRRRRHLPPPRAARVAADLGHRARLGGVGRRGDAPPGRDLAAGRGAARRDARSPRDLPARQPDRRRDRPPPPGRDAAERDGGRQPRRRSTGSPRRPRRTPVCCRTSRPGP